MKKIKIFKIISIVLAVLLIVGIFLTVREIAAKHQVVAIHKVINKENGEEVTVYDDPEFDDFLDEVLNDLNDVEDDMSDLFTDEDEFFIEDDLVIPDSIEEESYESKNPKKGSAVSEEDTNRDITISLSDVAYSDFMSSGGNSFPSLTSDAATERGSDSVDWEITKYFYDKLHGGYTRMLFCMDAMITDSYNGQDPVAAGLEEDLNSNQDYLNYINGAYSFDNDQMQSFWRMVEAQQEAGSEIWLNTGWKVAQRIQSWYGASSAHPKDAAPYDVKAFVKANIALLLECEARYPGAVTYIIFGNEPAEGRDFAVDGDLYRYTTILYTLMREALRYQQTDRQALKGIRLGCGEDSWLNYKDWDQSYMFTGSELLSEGIIDAYAAHAYYYPSWNYEYVFDRFCFLRETMNNGPAFVNETAMCSYDNIGLPSDFFKGVESEDDWWNFTYASYLVAAANSGMRGVNKWSYGSYYWPISENLGEPNSENGPIDNCMFETQNDLSCNTQYYTVALFQNYITAYSDVLTVDWEGEDLRVAAFKLSDGNYTIFVEAKGGTLSTRELNFKLDGTLGKSLYRIAYSEATDTLTDTLIPISDSTWTKHNVGSTFTDTIDGNYGTYVYTTKKPVAQLKAADNTVTVAAGKSVVINVDVVDASVTDVEKVEWSIEASASAIPSTTYTQYAATKGSISGNGTYTADDDAQSGDRIVLKATATLGDGSEISTVVLVTIE